MDIRVLNYFVTIVQQKSITNAARSLHVTQPTLSRQIRELEEELGAPLLIRGSREVQMTEQGQFLYNRALEILALVKKTEQSIRFDDEISGTISIGAAESQSLATVAYVASNLTQNHSQLQFSFFSGNADEVQEKLGSGLLDFGVILGEVNHKKYDSLPLGKGEQWGVLVPNSHQLTAKHQVTFEDIAPYPIIVSSQANKDVKWRSIFKDFHIAGSYNLLFNAALLVEAGMGIAIGLDGIVNRAGLSFIPFDTPMEENLNLIWRRYSHQPKIAKVFLDALKDNILDA